MLRRSRVSRKGKAAKRFSRDVQSVKMLNLVANPKRGGIRL